MPTRHYLCLPQRQQQTTMLRYFCLLVLAGATCSASAQFIGTSPTRDGNIASNEYGNHSSGANALVNGSSTWYMNWDATTLYVAVDGGFNPGNDAVALYFDTNPTVPVNGASGGTTTGTTFDNVSPFMPLAADVFVYVKNGYNAVATWNGSSWSIINNPLSTVFTDGNTTEFAITFSQLGLSGRPNAFNFLGMITYGSSGGGAFAEVPTANDAAAGNSTLYYYYTVSSTADGAATPPFSQLSFTQHNTGLFAYTSALPTTLWDFTIYDNQPASNADNISATGGGCTTPPCETMPNRVLVSDNFTINNTLYIGAGSALLPNNSRTPTISINGTSPTIYNEGRLECVPDIAARLTRRLDFSFPSGQTTLAATSLDKSLYRFSNIYIGSTASIQAPASGSASIELEYGTLTNDGTLNFVNGSGYVDVGLRGGYGGFPLSANNDYYFQNGSFSVGTFQLNGFLIGQDASRLLPVNTATNPVITLKIAGNFENYYQFVPQNGSGQIDVVLNGTGYQEIRGTIGETVGNTTTFHNLTINNDNGQGNDNSGADVGFQSYGGGTISYEISGQLTLAKGDLRTRSGSTTHSLVLMAGASLSYGGAQSDLGGSTPSCFVDGPLTWELASTGPTTLDFPIGKSSGINADYRPVNLALMMDAATTTRFTAEVFTAAAPAYNDAAAAAPDPAIPAGKILNYHYWRVSHGAGANVVSARITLAYATAEYSDQVTDPTSLRILKDDGGGNWVNLSPGIGGTATGNGTITSDVFSTFSDFALADLNLPLDLQWVGLSLHQDRAGGQWLDWSNLGASTVSFTAFLVEKATTASGPFLLESTWENTTTTCPVGPLSSPTLFRVRAQTTDGRWISSNTVLAQPDGQDWYIWQPNSHTVWLGGGLPLAPDACYRIFDLSGRMIQSAGIAQSPLALPAGHLPPGTYLLQVMAAGNSKSFTFQIYP